MFTISRGSVTVQETLIVQIEHEGKFGYGEATTNSFYGATIENMSADARIGAAARRSRLARRSAAADRASSGRLPHAKYAKFALNALDQAIHDLWGKLRGAPVYKLWGLTTDKIPDSDYTLGIDTPEKMVAKMEEMPGWPVYKIKLGTADDLAIVRELRKHTDALFRVDANCGWTAEQTIEFAPVLKDLNVEFIEQPLPPEDVEGARRAFAESALPLIADENCIVESDVDRCAGRFPRHQHQAREMRRPGRGAADGHAGPRTGPASDGRLHDGIDRRHLGHRPAVAAVRLCRHGRRGAAREGHRHRRSPRSRQVHLSERQWYRRRTD